MKGSFRSVVAWVGLAALVGWFCGQNLGPLRTAKAFDDPTPKSIGQVATLDMSRVFKSHARFQEQSEAMRKRVLQADQTITTQKKAVEALEAKLKDLKGGSDEYRDAQKQVDLRKLALNAAVATQKRDFVAEEAKLYADTYEVVQGVVQRYADAHGIRLVLRINAEQYDLNKPEEVLKALNRSVVYQNEIEITEEIVRLVNQEGT